MQLLPLDMLRVKIFKSIDHGLEYVEEGFPRSRNEPASPLFPLSSTFIQTQFAELKLVRFFRPLLCITSRAIAAISALTFTFAIDSRYQAKRDCPVLPLCH